MGVQALISAFETFKPLADAIEDTVTGLSAAFKAFTSGGSLTDAYNQTVAYNEALRDLEDTQKSFEVQQAKYERDIERLVLQSKNRTKAEKERIALIDQANKIEEQSFKDREKRNREEANNEANKFNILAKLNKEDLTRALTGSLEEQKIFRDRLESRNRFDEEAFNKFQSLLLERVAIERESISVSEKLKNRRDALEKEFTDEKQKQADKQAAIDEKRKAQQEKDAQAEAKRVADFVKLKSDEAKALLKIDEDFNRDLSKQKEDALNDEVKRMRDEANAFKESQDAQDKRRQDAANYQKQIAAENIATQQAELQAAQSISNSFIGLISQVAEASGLGAEFQKALAFVQILISQAIAIGNALVGAYSISTSML